MPDPDSPSAEAATSSVRMSAAQAAFFARQSPVFEAFARQFSLDPKVVYLMAGQKGSQPDSVRKRYQEGLDQIARDPFPVHLEPTATTRERIARGYGASVDEIAISRNTTDALGQILMGIEWQRGDEILVTPMEHPAGLATVLRVSGRFGVKIVQWGVPVHRNATADEVVEALKKRLKPGVTRVVFFSSPLWPNGERLPERRIAALAQAAGAITVADGAHYGGMIDPRLDESGIDFWAISGHKWQCGPGGTGIIYIRNRALAANPTPLPRFHIIRSSARDVPFDGSRTESYDIGAAMSRYGFPESADWRALGDVCALWDEIGRARIQAWTHNLADYLRQRLVATFGEDALLQPTVDPALKSAIVCFNPFPDARRRTDPELNKRFRARLLQEYGFRISGGGVGPEGFTRAPDPQAAAFPEGLVPNRDPRTLAPKPFGVTLRANACVWNSPAQMDRFVAACEDLSRKMPA
ncbi:MAG: aminotransferase class V-fold PLP-dependent enzyme [Betaproteobacteria bacterium]|nr:aminotransferase class V-fold PLP-dependent enzyme [Betaproteobacteria bacterium]